MTVSSTTSRNDYVGNGTLDTYAYIFQIYVKTDLKVYVSSVLKTVDVHYIITGILNPAGGNVVFTTGNIPANLAPIAIILDLSLTQLIDYKEGDKFPAETHERGLDRLVKITQMFNSVLGRILKVPIWSTLSNVIVKIEANKYLRWNAEGTSIVADAGTTVGAHGENHENEGSDEISVVGLSGLLADDQHVLDAEVLAVAEDKTKKGIASGYASLDANVKIPIAQIPTQLLQNLLPNSRFGVFSRFTDVSVNNAVSVSSHTIGANQVVATTANTQELAVGMQVRFTAGNASLQTCPHTITVLTVNTSFTFNLEGNKVGIGGGAATAYESSIGDDTGSQTFACDHWQKSESLIFVRRPTFLVGTTRPNSLYCLKLKKGGAGQETFYYEILKSDHPGQLAEFAGRDVVFGMWVYATQANAVRLTIGDGVTQAYSSYATANVWTWLEVTAPIGSYSDITQLYVGAYLTGSIADIHHIACPMLSYGTYLGIGNYLPIKNEIVHVIAHISPTHYTGATIGGGDSRIFRIHDETHGQVPRDAKGIYAAFEGRNTDVSNVLAWWRNGMWDPLTHGHILGSQVTQVMVYSPVAPIQISYSGVEVYQYLYSTGAGQWTLVSMDIVGVWY